MKQCSKCEKWQNKIEFTKDKKTKDGLSCGCKECQKEYRENNKEKLREHRENNKENLKKWCKEYRENNKEKLRKYQKEHHQNNKEKLRKYNKEYRKENKNKLRKYHKKYDNSLMPFNSKSKYRKEIELYEEIKESENGNVMCKCAYCGGWFEPTYSQITSRVKAANGVVGGECRLYCSSQCKQACPTYGQSLYPKDMKPVTAREVQPQLRHMVFERDNYTCQKCNTHKNNLEVELHCHHIEGIQWEPLQSADTDMCITFCANCHKEVHKIESCGTQDMKCV